MPETNTPESASKKKHSFNKSKKDGRQGGIMDIFSKTIRGRKRPPVSNTQKYLPISEIRNDTVVLKNGGLRAVLELEPINFNLKSEDEQMGIIVRYQNFLNTLSFPIQIMVTSTRVNIDPYIEKVREQAKTQKSELLKNQTIEYAEFVQKLVSVADIMQKKFYIVVPQDDHQPKKNSLNSFASWMKTDDSASKISQRNLGFQRRGAVLRDRISLVQSGLHHTGINSRCLSTRELIELYYKLLNADSGQKKLKLPGDLNTEKLVI